MLFRSPKLFSRFEPLNRDWNAAFRLQRFGNRVMLQPEGRIPSRGFMGSLHLQIWTHIGAMNRAIGAPVSDPARFKTAVTNAPDRRSALRFMESPQFILKRIATMNLVESRASARRAV